MAQLNLQKIPGFYHKYVQLVTEEELQTAFRNNSQEIISLLKGLPSEKWDHKYAEGKWNIKEVIQHIIDAERIFCYRALTFARKDDKVLPGFDENHYTAVANAGKRTPQDLIEELEFVQKASAKLFDSFDQEQLQSEGSANNNLISVEGIGYVIIGHSRHHKNLLIERYL